MDQAALESRLANYQRLLTFSHILTSTLDLSALLDLIAHTAQDLTNTEATSILLIDPKTGDLFFEAVSGNKSEEVKREIVSPDSIAGWVARHGQPQIISDVSQDHRFSKKTDEGPGFRTRSLLAVPMKVNDRVIGVVEAVNRLGDAPFSVEDLDVLTVLSAQAAVAIENSRLFQQNDFVSEMVHELRTPLTSIIAYAELILRQEIPLEQAQGFIETIFQEANRLSKMTNDFLDFSRLQSGRACFNMTALDLAALTQEVTTLLKPQADEHSLQLQVTQSAAGPINVIGDRDRLRQVLVNLTSNAIKYNRPDATITITLEPQADRVKISVHDTGKGIPEKDLPRLFEKFFRVPDSEGFAHGSGLGLSIVKQIIDAHDSDIHVQSISGVGTTFSFMLKAA